MASSGPQSGRRPRSCERMIPQQLAAATGRRGLAFRCRGLVAAANSDVAFWPKRSPSDDAFSGRLEVQKICRPGEKPAYCSLVGPTVRAPLSMSRNGMPVSCSHSQPGAADATRKCAGEVTYDQGRPHTPVSGSSEVFGRLSRCNRPARSPIRQGRLHQISARQVWKGPEAGLTRSRGRKPLPVLRVAGTVGGDY